MVRVSKVVGHPGMSLEAEYEEMEEDEDGLPRISNMIEKKTKITTKMQTKRLLNLWI